MHIFYIFFLSFLPKYEISQIFNLLINYLKVASQKFLTFILLHPRILRMSFLGGRGGPPPGGPRRRFGGFHTGQAGPAGGPPMAGG